MYLCTYVCACVYVYGGGVYMCMEVVYICVWRWCVLCMEMVCECVCRWYVYEGGVYMVYMCIEVVCICMEVVCECVWRWCVCVCVQTDVVHVYGGGVCMCMCVYGDGLCICMEVVFMCMGWCVYVWRCCVYMYGGGVCVWRWCVYGYVGGMYVYGGGVCLIVTRQLHPGQTRPDKQRVYCVN